MLGLIVFHILVRLTHFPALVAGFDVRAGTFDDTTGTQTKALLCNEAHAIDVIESKPYFCQMGTHRAMAMGDKSHRPLGV